MIQVNQLENKQDFIRFLNIIFSLGKRRILVEAGLTFLSKLLKLKLINTLFVFKSNKKLKKNGYNNINLKYFKNENLLTKLE